MKTAILTHKHPGDVGGYESLLVSLRRALSGDILNIYRDKWDKDDYDYFIALDDVPAHWLPKDRPHTLYLTTPRRSFYDMYYFSPAYLRPLIWIGGGIDRRFIKNTVKDIVSISHCVRTRVYKTYQRESKVIYPCVDCDKYSTGPDTGYWFVPQRKGAKWKRTDVIQKAFAMMPDEEVMFGGDLEEYELVAVYSMCRGVITLGIDEDFGIVPLEAFASGKHCIAAMEGGYLETVSGVGALIRPTPNDLQIAVTHSLGVSDVDTRIRRAREFDYSIFKRQWLNHAKFITSEG